MANNSLTITTQYPTDRYNLLVSMQTVAEIASIHKPVMNVVSISTDLNDKEIYVQEKAYGKDPAKYAITKKGLTKLMRAAGIKILSSRPVVPSTCQKCANINAGIGKAVRCGACPNKDVKYEVRISVPQLTGENIEVVAHKEIIVDDVTASMTDKQKAEFLKFRNEMCETKALNRALRAAMQIKGTYLIEEFKKPFVVAYLVPNLDNAEVKEKAVEAMFSSAHEIYGGNVDNNNRRTVFVEDDPEDASGGEAQQTPIEPAPAPQALPPERPQATTARRTTPPDPNVCVDCGKKISNGVSEYSIENYGVPLCMDCQKKRGGNQ